MKLQKPLLAAILVGIAVQTSSCKKDKELAESKAKQEAKKNAEKNKHPYYNCPACGMG